MNSDFENLLKTFNKTHGNAFQGIKSADGDLIENVNLFECVTNGEEFNERLKDKETFIKSLIGQWGDKAMTEEQLGILFDTLSQYDGIDGMSEDDLKWLAQLSSAEDSKKVIDDSDIQAFLELCPEDIPEETMPTIDTTPTEDTTPTADSTPTEEVIPTEDTTPTADTNLPEDTIPTEDTNPTIDTVPPDTPTEIPDEPSYEEDSDGILLGGNWTPKTDYRSQNRLNIEMIWNAITEKGNKANNVNGEIDMPAFQGSTGDCVLISGMYAYASDDKGAQLIKDSITINKGPDGEIESYTVEFKGIGESYTITAKELKKATKFKLTRALMNWAKYSSGDDDMVLLELAYKKCANESSNEKLHFSRSEKKLNGVDYNNLHYMMTGNYPKYYEPEELIDELEAGNLSNDTVAQIGFEKAQKVKDINGDKVKLAGRHAYTISEINDETVTLLNPWNTGESIILSRETFEGLKNCHVLAVDLSPKEQEE